MALDAQWWADEEEELESILFKHLFASAVAGATAATAALAAEFAAGVAWDLVNEAALRWARRVSPELAASISATSRRFVTEALSHWISSGEPKSELIKTIKPMFGKVRAEMIAVTETTRAYAEGNREAWRASGVVDGIRWMTSRDEIVCPVCGELDGQVFPVDSLELPPAHPRCLPGDSNVLSCGAVTATSERWYDGDLVIINTASGNQLACTPNHPILTPDGWIAAGLLNVGSYVVSYVGGKRVTASDLDDKNVPTSIEEIVKTFGRSRDVLPRPVPITAKDFHGDGIGSKVAIVRANGFLGDSVNATSREHGTKRILGGRSVSSGAFAALSHAALEIKALWQAPDRIVGRRRVALVFAGAACGHHEPVGIGDRATLYPGITQPDRNGHSGDTKALGDSVFGFPKKVSLGNTSGFNTESGLGNLSTLLPADSAAFSNSAPRSTINKDLAQALITEAKHSGGIFATLPDDVRVDSVLNLSRRRFSGHVYNLQTENGWYVADGIITHNCRCYTQPVVNL